MAFPKGTVDLEVFNLGDVFANFSNTNLPITNTGLIRDKYSVKRMFGKSTGGQGIAKKNPTVIFDQVYLEYTWTGHIDIATSSIARDTSNSEANEVMDAHESAVFFVGDLKYEFPKASNQNEDQPSLSFSTKDGLESGNSGIGGWKYKIEAGTAIDAPNQWVVVDSTIVDAGNGTSRWSLTFKSWSSIFNLADDIIDA